MVSDNQTTVPITSSASRQEPGLTTISDDFVTRSIAVQEFGNYLGDSDTDTENATAPRGRRWVWLCRLPLCSKMVSHGLVRRIGCYTSTRAQPIETIRLPRREKVAVSSLGYGGKTELLISVM